VGGGTQTGHLWGGNREGVMDVLEEEGRVDGVVPDPGWVAGDPTFWEGDEVGAVFGRFSDVFDGFLDGGFEVEPA
jgi:hypothetical protein